MLHYPLLGQRVSGVRRQCSQRGGTVARLQTVGTAYLDRLKDGAGHNLPIRCGVSRRLKNGQAPVCGERTGHAVIRHAHGKTERSRIG